MHATRDALWLYMYAEYIPHLDHDRTMAPVYTVRVCGCDWRGFGP